MRRRAGLRTAAAADKPAVLDVWPGKPPGDTADIGAEKATADKNDASVIQSITNVSHPTLTVYRPAKDKDTGAAVVIAPGGGYTNLAWAKEGIDPAVWLNSIGVTGVVLKYRVPRRPDNPKDKPPVQALMDAQRSISLVRSKAKEWGIDPNRIGMLGFSAGGHLTAWASTNFDKRAYEPIDDADKVGCRPDFGVCVYPGGVIVKDSDALSPEIRVSKETPPMFFATPRTTRAAAKTASRCTWPCSKAGVPGSCTSTPRAATASACGPATSLAPPGRRRCDWMKDQGLLKMAAPWRKDLTSPKRQARVFARPLACIF